MTAPSKPSVGLIGCGKMGGAMAQAWLAADALSQLNVFDSGGIQNDIAAHPVVLSHTDIASFKNCLTHLDMLILAVKPQTMDALCADLKNFLPPKLCILSIAAGKTLSCFGEFFGAAHPVIRAMPNTPALIGKGMTVTVANASVDDAQKSLCQNLMGTLGTFDWIADEALMDAVTALSGSGPAYLFYLIETMEEAGKKAGLPDDLAKTLARQTVIGAAALAESDPETSPATLRENVTSPNGTTAAALSVLMDGRLRSIMTEAVLKAAARSRELSR